MRLHLIIAILCAVCSPLMATTYFVANAGSDAANGTSSGTAWQTVTNLNAHKALGDTWLFHSGDEFTNASHTALTPPGTNFIGVYGGTSLAIIDGNTNEGCLVFTNRNQLYVTNLWFKCPYSDTNENQSGGFSYNNGCVFLVATTTSNTKYTNVLFTNCVFTGTTEGLWAEAIDTNFVDGYYNVTVVGCTLTNQTANSIQPFTDNGSASFTVGPTMKFQFGDWYIGHNYLKTDGDTVQKGSGTAMELFNCTRFMIEYNTNLNSTMSNNAGGAGGGPVGWFWQMSTYITNQYNNIGNIHARFNGSSNVDGGGLDFDAATANCIAQYNYIHGCQGAGIEATSAGSEAGFSNVIRGNIDITNNTLANYPQEGSDMWLNFIGGGTQIYNNTVITASNCLDTTGCSGSVAVSNNIFATSFPTTMYLSAGTTTGNNSTPGGNPNWLNASWYPNINSPAYLAGTHITNDGGVYFDGSPISPYGVNLGALPCTNRLGTNGPFLLPKIGT